MIEIILFGIPEGDFHDGLCRQLRSEASRALDLPPPQIEVKIESWGRQELLGVVVINPDRLGSGLRQYSDWCKRVEAESHNLYLTIKEMLEMYLQSKIKIPLKGNIVIGDFGVPITIKPR